VASQTVSPHRFSFDDVQAMVVAGILSPDTRVELIDGVLLEMTPPGPQHGGAVEWLTEHFVIAARGAFRVRVQDTFLTTDGGFVLPDLMAIEPLPRDRLPDRALLVVEVAYSTHAHDRRKAAIYARSSVPEYWIVDIEGDEVLVHREPRGGGYAHITRHASGDVIEPLLGSPAVDVAALLAG